MIVGMKREMDGRKAIETADSHGQDWDAREAGNADSAIDRRFDGTSRGEFDDESEAESRSVCANQGGGSAMVFSE